MRKIRSNFRARKPGKTINAAAFARQSMRDNVIRMWWLAGFTVKWVKGQPTKGARRKLSPVDIAAFEAAQNRRNSRDPVRYEGF